LHAFRLVSVLEGVWPLREVFSGAFWALGRPFFVDHVLTAAIRPVTPIRRFPAARKPEDRRLSYRGAWYTCRAAATSAFV